MKTWIVYKHTLLIGPHKGWSYIGTTCQEPEERWRNGKGYSTQKKFYRAIKKYGWENFSHEILSINLTFEEANIKEKEFISLYDSKNNGYNSDDGGLGSAGHTVSDEARNKISKRCKGRKLSEEHKQKIGNANRGKLHGEMSDSHKQKLSLAHKGKKMSAEFKRKQSEIHKGKPSGIAGKKHSKETKLKMSLAKIGIKLSKEHKQKLSLVHKGKVFSEEFKKKLSQASTSKKQVICVETGEVFESLTAAAQYYNIAKASISACLSGKRKTAGNYHWKFKD